MKFSLLLIASILLFSNASFAERSWYYYPNVGMDLFLNGRNAEACVVLKTVQAGQNIETVFNTQANLDLLNQLNSKVTAEDIKLFRSLVLVGSLMMSLEDERELIQFVKALPDSDKYFRPNGSLKYIEAKDLLVGKSTELIEKYLVELGVSKESIKSSADGDVGFTLAGSEIFTVVNVNMYAMNSFYMNLYNESAYNTGLLPQVGVLDGQVILHTYDEFDTGYVPLSDFMANLPRVEAYCKDK